MKRLRLFLAIVVAFAVVPFAAVGAEGDTEVRSAVLDVEGMTCQSCASRIQATLTKIEGVREAEVTLAAKEARIVHDIAKVTTAQLVAAINAIGYKASDRAESGSPESATVADGGTGEQTGSSCSTPATTVADDDGERLSPEDLATVVDYVIDLMRSDEFNGALEKTDIEQATGVLIPDGAGGQIQRAVMVELQDYPELLAMVQSSGGRCSEYDACSLHGDLSGAAGETLEMYAREKSEDGQRFEDHPLPAFEALDLEGNRVISDDLRGGPAMLAFLAGHCTHSMDTFPILQELARTYGPEGLRVVGVVVNSGTPEDVGTWVSNFEPEYDVWVYENPSLGDIVGSHLVPTFLYVDEEGQVREKLVGYKTPEKVDSWVDGMLHADPAIASR